MAQDVLGQLALNPDAPETWEPLMRHAAEELAAGILEVAPRDPAFARWAISLYAFKALKASVQVVELASESIGEGRALDALLERNPSCKTAFGDFDAFRNALVDQERRSALTEMLKRITTSPLVQ